MPKIRLARKQATKKEFEDYQAEEGRLDYNIWYHKYVGQRRDISRKTRQLSRCVVARDAGWTKACKSSDAYFCLYFARGKCALGGDCTFLHRLPTQKDEERIPITRDCFGREKHATDREDMGGVGSFKRECKILYVGGLKNVPNLESMLIKNFKEWGQLDYVRLFKEKCYAFIKYKLRLCAEFAKEALDAHILHGASYMLDIRWATEDPDDLATKRLLQTRKQMMIEKVEEKGIALNDYSYNAPLTYNPDGSEQKEEQQSENTESSKQNTTTTATTEKSKKQSSKQPSTSKKSAKSAKKSMDAYSDYYKTYYPEMYEEMKKKMRLEMQEELARKRQEKHEKAADEAAKSQSKKQAGSGKEDLSYESYVHKQLREVTLLNKRKREQNEQRQKQRNALGSKVLDVYPETETQFGPSSNQQEEDDSAPPHKKQKTV